MEPTHCSGLPEYWFDCLRGAGAPVIEEARDRGAWVGFWLDRWLADVIEAYTPCGEVEALLWCAAFVRVTSAVGGYNALRALAALGGDEVVHAALARAGAEGRHTLWGGP